MSSGMPPTFPGFNEAQTIRTPRTRGGMPWWAKLLIVLAAGCGLVAFSCFGFLVYIGAKAPDTAIVSGAQLPARFMDEIRALGVLDEGEVVRHFYSDALLNIEDGFYLVTDRKVIIYNQNLETPSVSIPFERIASVEAEFSESWIEDGSIILELTDGTWASFPVSAEKGGDKRLYNDLKQLCESVERK